MSTHEARDVSATSDGERWWKRHGELIKTIDGTPGKFEVYNTLVSEIRADERSRLEQVCGLEKRTGSCERKARWFSAPIAANLAVEIQHAEDDAFTAGCEVGRELAKVREKRIRAEERAKVLADYSATESKAREDERARLFSAFRSCLDLSQQDEATLLSALRITQFRHHRHAAERKRVLAIFEEGAKPIRARIEHLETNTERLAARVFELEGRGR